MDEYPEYDFYNSGWRAMEQRGGGGGRGRKKRKSRVATNMMVFKLL